MRSGRKAAAAFRMAAVAALLVVAVPAMAGTIGGASSAGTCRDPECAPPDCRDAAAKAARLRQRIAELRTSVGVLTQRKDETARKAQQSFDHEVRGNGGSLGRFSEPFGAVADVRESLSSARADSLSDLIQTLDDMEQARGAGDAMGEAVGPLRQDLGEVNLMVQEVERLREQIDRVENEARRLEAELARLGQACRDAAGAPGGAPSRDPGVRPGGAPSWGGGGGRGGGGGSASAPRAVPGVPTTGEIDRTLGYLMLVKPASRRVVDTVTRTAPVLEAIARSAEGETDAGKRAQILAGAAPHVQAVRSEVDELVTHGQAALTSLAAPN